MCPQAPAQVFSTFLSISGNCVPDKNGWLSHGLTGWMIEPKSIRRFLTSADSIPVPVQLSFLFFSFQLILFALLMSRTVTSPRIATFSFFALKPCIEKDREGLGCVWK
jgi:hypothetical protein